MTNPARRLIPALLLLGLAFGAPLPATAQAPAEKVTIAHGFAMHGDVKYGPDFKHYDYADPSAPKGGEVRFATTGTFDSFNGFVLRGVPAGGLGNIFETLMVASADEPFTKYGLIAETIEVPEDRSWVAFNLRPEARFHDGSPITVDDVIFTFDMIKTKGHPFYRSYYADVIKAEKAGERRVRFTFGPGENRELPLIVADLPVLSKAWWSSREFDRTTLEIPLGSGPYRIEAFEPGRFVTYRRVPDYWGAKLPVNVGRHNFDAIRVDYYRDATVVLEAFKAGEFDIRQENSAKNWATGYDGPALTQGLIKKDEIPEQATTGMQGFIYNTRRAVFADRRVREALGYAFDFEWSNRTLFFDAYKRTRSYFDNSPLSARALPEKDEMAVLEPFRSQVPAEVFTTEYNPPKTDGTGNWRDGQRQALRLLREAGWTIKDQKLVNAQGQPLEFEILLSEPTFERIALPFAENLKRLGINPRVRTVDTAQYQRRVDTFDFDMIVASFGQSESPGNEQRDFWHSTKADVEGSRNVIGIKDPVVDRLIDLVIAAPDRHALEMRTRALDRVLQWGFYVIPHFHISVDRVAYWDRFSRPKVEPKQGFNQTVWWVDPRKDAALREKRSRLTR